MNIYVSNIAFTMSEAELEQQFAEFGAVVSVKIITDRDTGKSKGFGFVEMENEEDGSNAINELNGRNLKGREVQVKKAFPRKEGGFDGKPSDGGYKKSNNNNFRGGSNNNYSKWK